MCYIPDITERFPEGYGGVDMTPSYFGEPVDWSRAYKEDDSEVYDDETTATETSEPRQFALGNTYMQFGIFGGVTYYTVKEIDRKHNKILLSEEWEDVDGSGTRPSKWHSLEVDEDGNEKALEWESKEYGKIWIYS